VSKQRWIATWHEGGYSQEYIFYAPGSRILARLDFQLKLIEQGKPVPTHFELEEGQPVIYVVPNAGTVRR
jgi:hypothetical protein